MADKSFEFKLKNKDFGSVRVTVRIVGRIAMKEPRLLRTIKNFLKEQDLATTVPMVPEPQMMWRLHNYLRKHLHLKDKQMVVGFYYTKVNVSMFDKASGE